MPRHLEMIQDDEGKSRHFEAQNKKWDSWSRENNLLSIFA